MKHNLFLKAAAAALILAACSTEENTTAPSTTNLKAKEGGLAALQAKALNRMKQHFTVNTNEERATLKTDKGAIITFNPHELTVKGIRSMVTLMLSISRYLIWAAWLLLTKRPWAIPKTVVLIIRK